MVYTESSSHLQSQVCFRLPTIKTFKKPEIQLPLRSIQFIPLHSLYNLNSPTMLPLSNQSRMQCCSTEQSHVFLHNFYDYSVSVNTISCKFSWKMKSFKKSRLFFHFSFPQFIFIFHFPKREGGGERTTNEHFLKTRRKGQRVAKNPSKLRRHFPSQQLRGLATSPGILSDSSLSSLLQFTATDKRATASLWGGLVFSSW